MQTINFSGLGELGGLVTFLFIAATVLLHILFTFCIAVDVNRLREQGRTTVLLMPFAWALSALLLGLVAVAFYWVCHHSNFIKQDA